MSGQPSNELNLALGIDYAVFPESRSAPTSCCIPRLSGSIKMSPGEIAGTVRNAPLTGQSRTRHLSEFQVAEIESAESPGRLVIGTKVNPWRNLLLVGNVLVDAAHIRALAQAGAEPRRRVHVLRSHDPVPDLSARLAINHRLPVF